MAPRSLWPDKTDPWSPYIKYVVSSNGTVMEVGDGDAVSISGLEPETDNSDNKLNTSHYSLDNGCSVW